VCKTHTIAGKSVVLMFVKQECSVNQACSDFLENCVKAFFVGSCIRMFLTSIKI